MCTFAESKLSGVYVDELPSPKLNVLIRTLLLLDDMENKNSEEKVPKQKFYQTIWFWGIVIIVLWSGNLTLIWLVPKLHFLTGSLAFYKAHSGEFGTLGDMFGVVNSLFSGMAFLGLVYTIWQQQRSLDIQRDDYNLQIQEMSKQNSTLLLEQFENNYFSFMNILFRNEDQCSIEGIGAGKKAFHFMFYEYKAICYLLQGEVKEHYSDKIIDKMSLKGLAYNFFINGVVDSLTNRIKEENKTNLTAEDLEKINKILLAKQEEVANKENIQHIIMPMYIQDYKPGITIFDGHRLRLTPYFRVVCTCIEYLYETLEPKEDSKQFEFYRNAFISHFSEHELALLLIIYEFASTDTKEFITNVDGVKKFFECVKTQFLKTHTMNVYEDDFIKGI